MYPDPIADSHGPPTAYPEYLCPKNQSEIVNFSTNLVFLLLLTGSFQFLGKIVKNHENHNVTTFGCFGIFNQPRRVSIGFVRSTIWSLPLQFVILQSDKVIGSQSQLVDIGEHTIQIIGCKLPLVIELQMTVQYIISQIITQSQIG